MTLLYDSTLAYDSTTFYDSGGGPPPPPPTTGWFFTPPNVKLVPPFLPGSTPLEKSLWLHYENRERGVNVFIMSDGSVVQSDPTPENSNTDMTGVYPWNIDDPSGPYVRSIFIDPGANPQVPTEHDVSHPVYVVQNFYGASIYPIDTPTYNLLVAYTAFGIGYADCMTPV